jgi:hypothetical protein
LLQPGGRSAPHEAGGKDGAQDCKEKGRQKIRQEGSQESRGEDVKQGRQKDREESQQEIGAQGGAENPQGNSLKTTEAASARSAPLRAVGANGSLAAPLRPPQAPELPSFLLLAGW